MKRIFLFLLAVGFLSISEITAQNTSIDSDYKIIVTQTTSNGVYTNFDLNYADAQVVMKVQSLSSNSRGMADLNYLNGVLKRRSMAYQRLF